MGVLSTQCRVTQGACRGLMAAQCFTSSTVSCAGAPATDEPKGVTRAGAACGRVDDKGDGDKSSRGAHDETAHVHELHVAVHTVGCRVGEHGGRVRPDNHYNGRKVVEVSLLTNVMYDTQNLLLK
ncbi:hypothetical protein DOTSEDRAFT_73194, partial [Dothistroma septosporum NZE10]